MTNAGNTPPDVTVLEFECSVCGRRLRINPQIVTSVVKCPACGHVQEVAKTPAMPPTHAPREPTAPPAAPPAALRGAPAASTQIPAQIVPSAPGDSTASSNPPDTTNAPGISTPGPRQTAAATSSSTTNQVTATVTPRLSIDQAAEWEGTDTPTRQLFHRILDEIAKIYVGQDELVMGSLLALFSSGHVLIESVPGLGKTLFVRTLGRVLGCDCGRIQFTADLMPSDITGAPIFDMKTQEFRFRPGPVFTQFLLADEINRSPAKTHAALLETMQEYRVTVDGVSHELQRPFLVLATQNPIESEGTYNLPEAQLDRFMFKLIANYPSAAEEADILTLHSRQMDINQRLIDEVNTVTSPEEILSITRGNSDIRVDEKLIDYINKIVRLTREWPQFHMGASPRAGIALMQGVRTLAAFYGRDYAVPDDVVQIALPALRHRVILTAEADVEGHSVDDLLTDLIRSVEVPRL